MRPVAYLALGVLMAVGPAAAEERFTVTAEQVRDLKSVFATVESEKVIAARARIGGTVGEISVREGTLVKAGERLAAVGDEKLVTEILALEAEAARARSELARAQDLAARGVIPRAQLERAQAEASVADSALRAKSQLLKEGEVLAPADGRVLRVPVVAGSVVLPGEPVAVIAAETYVLRLRLPERHARFMKAGDPVRLDAGRRPGPPVGRVRLVYPQIEDGRIVADADVEGLGGFFVGERIAVWVAAEPRTAIIVPEHFVQTRFGIDMVRLVREGGPPLDVPVQRGDALPDDGAGPRIEILSGLAPGDVLVAP